MGPQKGCSQSRGKELDRDRAGDNMRPQGLLVDPGALKL